MLLMQQNRVYSSTRKMYLAGCELHIQTLRFLIVFTLKQYVNAKTMWGSKVGNINRCYDYSHDDCYAASILAHS